MSQLYPLWGGVGVGGLVLLFFVINQILMGRTLRQLRTTMVQWQTLSDQRLIGVTTTQATHLIKASYFLLKAKQMGKWI